jgi:hypothetical protein
MGIVWAATHLVTKRSVAIKVLRATLLVARLLERDRDKREVDMKKVASSLARFGSVEPTDEGVVFRPGAIVAVVMAVLVVGSLGLFFGARQTVQRAGLMPPPVMSPSRAEPTHVSAPPSVTALLISPSSSASAAASAPPLATAARVVPATLAPAPSLSAAPAPTPSDTAGPGHVIVKPPF